MTELTFAADTGDARPLYLVCKEDLDDWLAGRDDRERRWIKAAGFKAAAGELVLIPSSDGSVTGAAGGLGDPRDRSRGRFVAATFRKKLPAGPWRYETGLSGEALAEAALAWLLAGYRYDRFKASAATLAELVAPHGVDARRLERIAAGEALARDLINAPASVMGPDELESAARALAGECGATIEVTAGERLPDEFPMIHAVGRASPRAPRLVDLRWGNSGPRLTLVGKGVCFDTGGLNLKTGTSMAQMKKDMGGAANVLGLARMLMTEGAQCQLRVLIPAVENAVSGASFRPGDVLTSRKGLTVEINNTDAEGRLVLADALALADEERPALIVSMATLTGAARVAVGPDLAPFYATLDADAQALAEAGRAVRDPVWRLPFWDPYEPMIEPDIADLDNAPSGGFAGSITAALFLRRFVTGTPRYIHFDIYGWTQVAAPGRPKGGAGQGIRALHEALPGMIGT